MVEVRDATRARTTKTTGRAITVRSVVLGLILAAALAAITPYNDYNIGNTYIAGNHFPIGAVAVLLLLSLLNLLVRRLRGRGLFDLGELAVIYIIIMVTSGLASSGLLRYLIPTATMGFYFAEAGNRWQELFWGYIPPWVGVSDKEAVNWFWEGLPSGARMPWGVWVYTLSRWLIFVFAMWMMMTCLAALVRKQWADRERLTFPLVQFPLEVLRDDGRGASVSFFANKLVWIGAGLVFLIHVINGLHRNFPAVPAIPTFINLDQSLPDRPWDTLGPIYIAFFFSAIGFGYLLPLEVSAGFWVSVLFIKVQGLVLRMIGYEGGSAWGGVISQISNGEQMGGLVAIAAVLLWLLRGTFAEAFRNALGLGPRADDGGEPLSYRFAAIGLVVGVIVQALWLHAAGMTAQFIALFLVFFISICLALTRIAAEAGILMIQLSFAPTDYLLLFGGSTALGPANLTILNLVDTSLTFDLREFLMPSVLNGFRMSEVLGIRTRRITPVMAAALILVLAVAIPAFLLTMYLPGVMQMPNQGEISFTRGYFEQLASRLQTPENPSTITYVANLAGIAIVGTLAWLRINFVWWPIHPLGFIMATSWSSLNLWFSLFLGWLFKLLTIRYTGLRGYVQFRPLFLGLVMGDVLAAVLWQIVGWFTGHGMMVTVN